MFLERCYENRAVGLVAAVAVLITGAIATGAIDTKGFAPAPAPAPVKAIDAASLGIGPKAPFGADPQSRLATAWPSWSRPRR